MSEQAVKPLRPSHADDCAFVQRRQNCSCDYPRYIEAIETVAQRLIYQAVTEFGQDAWEDYPDLGQYTWLDVLKRADRLTCPPDPEEYESAYAALSALADGAS